MSKGYRRISVDGEEYEWRVGLTCVDIRPLGKTNLRRTSPSIAKVTGLSPDQVERGQWKGWLTVAPGQIRDYIVKEIEHVD